jgi:hypothetical protein
MLSNMATKCSSAFVRRRNWSYASLLAFWKANDATPTTESIQKEGTRRFDALVAMAMIYMKAWRHGENFNVERSFLVNHESFALR